VANDVPTVNATAEAAPNSAIFRARPLPVSIAIIIPNVDID
jgi:hypothetical protein